jgi:hypothetical protein
VCTVMTAELAQRVGWSWPPSAAFDPEGHALERQERQNGAASGTFCWVQGKVRRGCNGNLDVTALRPLVI